MLQLIFHDVWMNIHQSRTCRVCVCRSSCHCSSARSLLQQRKGSIYMETDTEESGRSHSPIHFPYCPYPLFLLFTTSNPRLSPAYSLHSLDQPARWSREALPHEKWLYCYDRCFCFPIPSVPPLFFYSAIIHCYRERAEICEEKRQKIL